MSDLIVAIKADAKNFKRTIGSLEGDFSNLRKTGVNAGNKIQTRWQKLGGTMNSLKKRASGLGKTLASPRVAGSVAALTAGLSAMTVKSTQAGKELVNMTNISDTGVENFQKWAFAARGVGVEQGKMADIFKDVNDRVGDFITTGAGPMADFFEQVAPQVGVTADQFAKLSGPEALQLFVSTMEEAGLSQQEMTFHMEALAGDATALLPLLRNNGSELERLKQQAEEAGVVMSEETAQSLAEAAGEMSTMKERMEIIGAELTAALLPAFKGFVSFMQNAVVPAFQKLDDIGQGIGKAFSFMNANVRQATLEAEKTITAEMLGIEDQVGKSMKNIKDVSSDETGEMADDVKDNVEDMGRDVNRDLLKMQGDVDRIFDKIKREGSGSSRELERAVCDNTADLTNCATEHMFDLIDETEQIFNDMRRQGDTETSKLKSVVCGNTKELSNCATRNMFEMIDNVDKALSQTERNTRDSTSKLKEAVCGQTEKATNCATRNMFKLIEDTEEALKTNNKNVEREVGIFDGIITMAVEDAVGGATEGGGGWLGEIFELRTNTEAQFRQMGVNLMPILNGIGRKIFPALNDFTGGWLDRIGDMASDTTGIFRDLKDDVADIVEGFDFKAPGVTVPVTVNRRTVSTGGGGEGGSLGATAGTAIGTAVGGPIGGAIGGALGSLLPFAHGGAVTGPTLGMVGEAPGVNRGNPEFIGTAEQLSGMFGSDRPIVVQLQVSNRTMEEIVVRGNQSASRRGRA